MYTFQEHTISSCLLDHSLVRNKTKYIFIELSEQKQSHFRFWMRNWIIQMIKKSHFLTRPWSRKKMGKQGNMLLPNLDNPTSLGRCVFMSDYGKKKYCFRSRLLWSD